MRIETPGPVRKPLPLTPLVDVVFLLLMFFMLSSTFTKFGGLDMGHPAAAGQEPLDAAAASKAPGVIIAVAGGPRIRINGIEAPIEDLAAGLDSYYDKGARSGVITLAATAEVQDLVTVLERARRSKLRAIAVAR